MSSLAGKCSICQKSLGKNNKSEVTTTCHHTFHRECAEQQLIKSKSNDCPKCNKKSALEHVLTGDTVSASKRSDSTQIKPQKMYVYYSY
jgi:hypothetical protein